MRDEQGFGDFLRQRRRQEKVQEDLRALRLALLYTSAAATHMTSRAGGAAEDAAAVMHLLTHQLRDLIHDPVASVLVYI